jgi:hypothetical protein
MASPENRSAWQLCAGAELWEVITLMVSVCLYIRPYSCKQGQRNNSSDVTRISTRSQLSIPIKDSNLKKKKFWSKVPDWARHQDILTDWPLVVMWLWLWLWLWVYRSFWGNAALILWIQKFIVQKMWHEIFQYVDTYRLNYTASHPGSFPQDLIFVSFLSPLRPQPP